jgi:hypothetical protein
MGEGWPTREAVPRGFVRADERPTYRRGRAGIPCAHPVIGGRKTARREVFVVEDLPPLVIS